MAPDRRVKDALRLPAELFREVKGGQVRLRDRVGPLLEAEELVMSVLAEYR